MGCNNGGTDSIIIVTDDKEVLFKQVKEIGYQATVGSIVDITNEPPNLMDEFREWKQANGWLSG